MKRSLLIPLILLLGACTPFEPTKDIHIVVVDKPVTWIWRIRDEIGPSPQHAGVSGNLGHFPNTKTPQGDFLQAIILGDALTPGSRVPVTVIGVHEQVDHGELMSTILTTTDKHETLETIEQATPGSLAVIEAALVMLHGENAGSLGFRSKAIATTTIANYRDAFGI